MKSITKHRLAAPLGIALLASLGACGPVNRGLEPGHQPVVSRADYSIDVTAGDGGLAQGEAQRLDGWFASLHLGYGDSIAVDDPSSYGSPGSRDAIAQVAARYGLLLGNEAPVTPGDVPTGSVRVVVSRATARVDGCPDWRRPSEPEFASSASSNLGCATNTNLAAMVANPQDLVRGQAGTGTGDAVVASKAINQWRTADPSGKGGIKTVATSKASN